MKTIIFFLVIFSFHANFANTVGSDTGLELPRYVSLKSDESNLRIGPSKNYPISIKYMRRDYPLKIIEEYSDWRKIIDFKNNTGWIHKSLIKGERNGIIVSDSNFNIEIYNTSDGKIIGYVENGSIVFIPKCKTNWCQIHKNNYKGWVRKEYIWGVKKNEEFNLGLFQMLFDYYFKSINFIHKHTKRTWLGR